MENKIFDEFPRVDCSDCSHYWDDSCNGVPQGSEKRCTAFLATRRVDIPQQIKKLNIAFRWLTVSCALIAVAMIVHVLTHVIGR